LPTLFANYAEMATPHLPLANAAILRIDNIKKGIK
jgi:hypothetical protein